MLWAKAAGAGGTLGEAEGWNISTATFLQSKSVSAQDTTPSGVFFKPDGMKVYVVGFAGRDINEYNLSTAWDVSTATFLQTKSVSAQETSPQSVFFKPDGTKMYVMGTAGKDVNEYNLSTAWNVSTATFLQTKSVSAQETSPQSVFFKPDGTKMYVLGRSGDDVNEYNLSTAWNVSTATFLQSKSVSAQDTSPTAIFFKPDGTKMYFLGLANRLIYEYNLSTAWNVQTAVFLQSKSYTPQAFNPYGLAFKPDGTKMYIVGTNSDAIDEYDVTA
jgi:DNA-binding beta-propeller fold protein YncE